MEEDVRIALSRMEQRLTGIEHDVSGLKAVQGEIRMMNETLITLVTEFKHTNQHQARHEQKIDEIEAVPKMRLQQIATAIIAAIAGAIISTIVGLATT